MDRNTFSAPIARLSAKASGSGTSSIGSAQASVDKGGDLDASVGMGAVVGKVLKIGEYRVRVSKPLAEGGFGFVHTCTEVDSGKPFVLKRLVCQDADSLSLATTEMSILTRLPVHPNIVRFHGATHMRNEDEVIEIFLLLEYCQAGTVRGEMAVMEQTGGRYSEERILEIFSDVCEAVVFLHSQQPPIAHRDLKLENILIGPQGQYKLCDFGSCKQGDVVCSTRREVQMELECIQTTTTMQYRSPEMIDLHRYRTVKANCDVWALGCLLYEMVYGVHPFAEGDLQIVNCVYKIPKEPAVSKGIVGLITTALTPDPARRPSSAHLLAQVRHLRGLPVSSPSLQTPVVPTPRPSTPSRNSKASAVTVTAPSQTTTPPSTTPSQPPGTDKGAVRLAASAESETAVNVSDSEEAADSTDEERGQDVSHAPQPDVRPPSDTVQRSRLEVGTSVDTSAEVLQELVEYTERFLVSHPGVARMFHDGLTPTLAPLFRRHSSTQQGEGTPVVLVLPSEGEEKLSLLAGEVEELSCGPGSVSQDHESSRTDPIHSSVFREEERSASEQAQQAPLHTPQKQSPEPHQHHRHHHTHISSPIADSETIAGDSAIDIVFIDTSSDESDSDGDPSPNDASTVGQSSDLTERRARQSSPNVPRELEMDMGRASPILKSLNALNADSRGDSDVRGASVISVEEDTDSIASAPPRMRSTVASRVSPAPIQSSPPQSVGDTPRHHSPTVLGGHVVAIPPPANQRSRSARLPILKSSESTMSLPVRLEVRGMSPSSDTAPYRVSTPPAPSTHTREQAHDTSDQRSTLHASDSDVAMPRAKSSSPTGHAPRESVAWVSFGQAFPSAEEQFFSAAGWESPPS